MAETPLASVAQLGAYLQQTFDATDPAALLVVRIASAIIRSILRQEISQVLGDVVLLDPVEGYGFLPEFPITAITLFETYDATVTPGLWRIADPLTFTASRNLGIIAGSPGNGVAWPTNPETWRVTYDHGYPVIPDDVMAVVVSLAARIYVTEDGIDSERIGGYLVKYQSDADGLSPLQVRAISRHMRPRIA